MDLLRMYVAWIGPDPSEGAILVFASTGREARRIGYGDLSGFHPDNSYIDVRVRWLPDDEYGYLRDWDLEYGDGAMVDVPHIAGIPPTCYDCQMWGTGPLVKGLCADCRGAVG